MRIRLPGLLLILFIAGIAGAGHPLEPLDTSSPRATLESFLVLTDEAARRFTEYHDAPNPTTQAALLKSLVRGWRLLDLSQVPSASRQQVADDTFVLLWAGVSRLQLRVGEEPVGPG